MAKQLEENLKGSACSLFLAHLQLPCYLSVTLHRIPVDAMYILLTIMDTNRCNVCGFYALYTGTVVGIIDRKDQK